MEELLLNQIKTPDGTILRSHSRHDYVTHVDANGHEYMVDGGYLIYVEASLITPPSKRCRNITNLMTMRITENMLAGVHMAKMEICRYTIN